MPTNSGPELPAAANVDAPANGAQTAKAAIADTLSHLGLSEMQPVNGDMVISEVDPSAQLVFGSEQDQFEAIQIPVDSEQATPEQTEQETSSKAIRAQYLAAQKAQRKAQKEIKRVSEMSSRADRFTQSTQNWQNDPAQLLIAAGIQPKDYIERLVLQGANQPKVEIDPVHEKIQAAMKPYFDELVNQRQQISRHQEMVAESNLIDRDVVPVVKNADKYEALISFNGGDTNTAAIYVYQAVKDHWTRTGEVIPFETAADQLENYHYEQLNQGINKIKGMKKFAPYFQGKTEISTGPRASKDQSKQKTATRTLTANDAIKSLPPAHKAEKAYRPADPRGIEATLAKFGLTKDGQLKR
jgi:hypothetical protein